MEEDYPPLGEIPTEEFESLESLELDEGAALTFPPVMRPHRLTLSGALVVPFPALSELQITYTSLPLNALEEVVKERRQAGHGINTFLIRGRRADPIDEFISRLREFVGELVLNLVGS